MSDLDRGLGAFASLWVPLRRGTSPRPTKATTLRSVASILLVNALLALAGCDRFRSADTSAPRIVNVILADQNGAVPPREIVPSGDDIRITAVPLNRKPLDPSPREAMKASVSLSRERSWMNFTGSILR